MTVPKAAVVFFKQLLIIIGESIMSLRGYRLVLIYVIPCVFFLSVFTLLLKTQCFEYFVGSDHFLKELVENFSRHLPSIPENNIKSKSQEATIRAMYPVSVQRIQLVHGDSCGRELIEPLTRQRSRSQSMAVRDMDESVLQLLTWEVDWSNLPPYAAKHFASARSIFIENLISEKIKIASTNSQVFFLYILASCSIALNTCITCLCR